MVEREAGVDDIIAAATGDRRPSMAKAGDFWTNGWIFNPGELPDESVIPSAGPYKLSSWESGNNITLVANDELVGRAAGNGAPS